MNETNMTIIRLPFATVNPRTVNMFVNVGDSPQSYTFTCTGLQQDGSSVIENGNIELKWLVNGSAGKTQAVMAVAAYSPPQR